MIPPILHKDKIDINLNIYYKDTRSNYQQYGGNVVGYPNKFIEKVVDEARDLLSQKYTYEDAINKALDKCEFQRSRDRHRVGVLVKRKLAYRAKNKRRSNQKRRAIAENNLFLPFTA